MTSVGTMPADQGEAPPPLTRRQRLMWGLFDFSQGRGLEIGPLHQTVAPKSRSDVVYLDVFDRELLLEHYGDNPGVPCELIPQIDYALFDGERVRSIPETVGVLDEPFDWVMASHVIEHVPDVIGWLAELAEVTADGGHLVLAIPDRHYCFDLHRPGTTLGQLLQAHEDGDVVPSVRAVYDYKRGHASVQAPMIWGGSPPGYERRIYSLETVLDQVARARAGEYVDSHVWTFTPGSFVEQIVELRLIGQSSWKVASVTPTRRDELEFYAVLERLPRHLPWTQEVLAGEPPLPTTPDWLAEQTQLHQELTELRRTVAQLRQDGKRQRTEAKRLQEDSRRLRRENKRLRSREKARFSYRAKDHIRRLPGGDQVLAGARGVRNWLRGRRDGHSRVG